MPFKRARTSRKLTVQMPDTLDLSHVVDVMPWPLGLVMARKAVGQGWTDCIIELDWRIKLGGKFNTRRVRYDGRLYIVHKGRRVYLTGELAWRAWETVQHVYGIDENDDKAHNRGMKGY